MEQFVLLPYTTFNSISLGTCVEVRGQLPGVHSLLPLLWVLSVTLRSSALSQSLLSAESLTGPILLIYALK